MIDGIRLKGNFIKSSKFDFYTGSEVNYQDPESIQSLSDFGIFGGMINYRYKNCRLETHWQLKYLDGNIAELNWSPLAGNSSTWNRTTAECSNTYCHGNFAGGYSSNNPIWTSTG